MVNDQFAWYLARSSGVVAWGLLSGAMIWGILLSTRVTGNKPRPAWVTSIHRYLGGLGLVFTGIHMAALWADSYVEFGLIELIVPFSSGWRPVAVAWGVIAFWLLLAVEVTSLLQRRVPNVLWRRVHLLAFPLWVLASVHLVMAGTDVAALLLPLIVSTALVGFLTATRFIGGRRGAAPPRPARQPSAGGSPVSP